MEGKSPVDLVNHPPHYNTRPIETIDVIINELSPRGAVEYCNGNLLKYLSRYKFKNGIEDLKKGRWYLNKMIEIMEAGE